MIIEWAVRSTHENTRREVYLSVLLYAPRRQVRERRT